MFSCFVSTVMINEQHCNHKGGLTKNQLKNFIITSPWVVEQIKTANITEIYTRQRNKINNGFNF